MTLLALLRQEALDFSESRLTSFLQFLGRDGERLCSLLRVYPDNVDVRRLSLTSALLFAVLHPPIIVMVEVFFIGLLLAYMVKETKSIWPGVLIHMLNNALVFGYLLFR